MAQCTVLLPGHWDSPGTAGAAPCPRVEMSRRCWSDILWLQTRAPRGQGRGRHSRDGFPGSIVRTERRKQLGATPAHFQGSGVPPVAMLPHKSLWRESTSAQISCPPPHQLHCCISSGGEASGHVLPLWQRFPGSCWGDPRSTPPTPGGHPTISTGRAAWGQSRTRDPSRSVQGVRDGKGVRRGLRSARCHTAPSLHHRTPCPATPGRDGPAPTSQHHTDCTHVLPRLLDPTLTCSACGKMLPSSPPNLNQPCSTPWEGRIKGIRLQEFGLWQMGLPALGYPPRTGCPLTINLCPRENAPVEERLRHGWVRGQLRGGFAWCRGCSPR